MPVLSEAIRTKIKSYIERYPSKQAVTLPALHLVQEELRCVPLEAMREIAELLDLHPAQVHDTMSFYGYFRDKDHPLGKHRVWVCRSLSCMLRGGEELLVSLSHKTGLKPGETSKDGRVTLEFAECLGACEGAPCMLIDEACHMNVTPAQAMLKLAELE